MKEYNFCAENLILGRFFSGLAKKISSEKDILVNVYCIGRIRILGKKEGIVKKYSEKFNLARSGKRKGPFFSKNILIFIKKVFRGMVNYRKDYNILRRIRFFEGKVPKGKEIEKIRVKEFVNKFIYLEELMKEL